MNKIALSIFLMIYPQFWFIAQNEVDALRYSQTTLVEQPGIYQWEELSDHLGADFSTISSNPAGLGLYKKSEFTITPSFYMGATKSDYNGNSTG